jgi:hypothetical protein
MEMLAVPVVALVIGICAAGLAWFGVKYAGLIKGGDDVRARAVRKLRAQVNMLHGCIEAQRTEIARMNNANTSSMARIGGLQRDVTNMKYNMDAMARKLDAIDRASSTY